MMDHCKFCGVAIEADPKDVDVLTYSGELNFGICDDCARKAMLPSDRPGELHWARARLALFPELAR